MFQRFLERISSRKFLLTLGTDLAAIYTVFAPNQVDAANKVVVSVAALLSMAAVTCLYIIFNVKETATPPSE